MDKKDNMDTKVNVNEEEIPKLAIVRQNNSMDQCSVDIVRDLDVLNLFFGII